MSLQRPTRTTAQAVVLFLAGVISACAGCRVGGTSTPDREIDRLRAENSELSRRVVSLTAERDESRAKLEACARTGTVMNTAQAGAIATPGPVGSNPPTAATNQGHPTTAAAGATSLPDAAESALAAAWVVAINIGSLSGLTPIASAGTANGVVVYVEAVDGRVRPVQVVGDLRIEVRLTSGDRGGEIVASGKFTPLQLRDAFRSGLSGGHYALELPLQRPLDRPLPDGYFLDMEAAFTEAGSGRTLKATRRFTR